MHLTNVQGAKVLIIPLILQFFIDIYYNSIRIARCNTWIEPVAVPVKLI